MDAAMQAPDAFTEALAQGTGSAALIALGGGFGASLTGCVYPMVAVTVSVFGAKQAQSRWTSMALSAVFVSGIIALLVPLGVSAALTGSFLGSVLQNRWLVIAMVALFFAMAASMLGAFEMALPSGVVNRLATIGGAGYRGAFLLGLVCALIATPCTGPILTGILAYIANTRSVGLGVLMMTMFGLGLGAPFFVVGAFAMQLPKSGRWMEHVKSVLAMVLIVTGLYFLSTTFPALAAPFTPGIVLWAGAVTAIVLGILFGAVTRTFSEPGVAPKLAKGTGLLLACGGVFAILMGILKPPEAKLAWQKSDVEVARALALRENRPLLVDFTAAWCVACKKLDKFTFAEKAVGSELGRFVAVKVDATHADDPKVADTMGRYRVRGLPTVLVFDSRGKEAVRITDFVPPEEFLPAIQRVD
jgi:thiol:disulfide interchange protein DsbD